VRRVLAILGAVAMIVAAVLIRRQLDEQDGHEHADDKIVIVCAEDLRTYCEALGDDVEIRYAKAADTADALRDGSLDDDVDGWITTSAWLEVTDTAEGGRPTGDLEALASSPIAASAAKNTVGQAVVDLCKGKSTWDCLGEHAGESWSALGQPISGDLAVGVTDADTAVGLPVLASIGGGTFGDLDFHSNDFDSAFASRIQALKAGSDPDPLKTMVTAAGAYAAASSTEAQRKDLADRVEVLALDPEVTATVVLVQIPGGDDLPSGDPVRRALAADGWSSASSDTVPLTLKDGVMSALHQVWTDS
jgi:hypothetical protein